MGRIIFCLVLLFNTHFLFSQNEYLESVDSLNYLIDNEENSIKKINHYQALCDIHRGYSLQNYKKSNAVLLSYATKTNSKLGLGFYYCNLSKITYLTDRSKAKAFAKKSCELFYAIKDWDNYIYAYSYVLKYSDAINQSDVDAVLDMAIKKDSKYISNIYLSMSWFYDLNNNYSNALLYLEKALKCKKPFKNIVYIYEKIADVHRRMENYDKALIYIDLAIKSAKNSDATYFAILTKVNLYCDTKQSEKALPLAFICSKYFKEQGYEVRYIYSQFMISYAYYNLKNYKKANYYVDQVLKTPTDDKEVQIDRFSHKANICLGLNDIKTATVFNNKALDLLDNAVTFNMKIYTYETKVELEKKIGNYKIALLYQELINETTNIENNKNSKSKLRQLEVDIDLTEKNNSIKNLQIAQLKKEVEIKTKNDYLVYALFSVLFLGGLILFYVYNHNLIKTKNTLINISNTKLANERDKSQKSLLEKETLLKEIHHRVKNNMQLVISLLKIQSRDSKQLSIDDFIEISENRIRSMALIHEYLYESENISFVNFEEYVKRLLSSIKSSFSGLQVQLETDINEANFDIETSISLGLIINELVINAYKHAFTGVENGVIKIKLINEDGFYHLTIQDNGVGIPANVDNGKSVGLKIVKLLVSQISGTLTILNDSGAKSVIQFKKITLPNYE